MRPPILERRDFLRRPGLGLGILGPAELHAAQGTTTGPHFAPKAKRLIHFYLNGGPSHALATKS